MDNISPYLSPSFPLAGVTVHSFFFFPFAKLFEHADYFITVENNLQKKKYYPFSIPSPSYTRT